LRNTLLGTRAILYFGARGDAGLTISLTVLTSELVFWALVGLGAMFWYDHRRPDRTRNLVDPLDRTDGPAVAKRDTQREGRARPGY
jgi:hypothetical protein